MTVLIGEASTEVPQEGCGKMEKKLSDEAQPIQGYQGLKLISLGATKGSTC